MRLVYDLKCNIKMDLYHEDDLECFGMKKKLKLKSLKSNPSQVQLLLAF